MASTGVVELRRLLLLAVLFQIVDRDYPPSVYPSGAVLLFALETWLGGAPTRVSNGFLMILPPLTAGAAIWRLDTRRSGWFAALVAL